MIYSELDARSETLSFIRPKCILIELTNHCNLECTTCARNDLFGTAMAKGNMGLDKLRAIAQEVKDFVEKIVLVGMGETLLYKRLPEAVQIIKSIMPNVQLSITTNATIPNSESVLRDICVALPTSVVFSVDGTGSTYESIRLRSDYKQFFLSVKRITETVPAESFGFNMVVFDKNFMSMRSVVSAATSLGISNVHLNSLNLAALPTLPLSTYDFYYTKEFRDELRRVKLFAQDSGIHLTTFDFEGANGFQKCIYPWNDFYITWDGYLAQCCAQPFPKRKNFGNVFEDGFLTCVNGPDFREVREMWHANKTPEICKSCHKIQIRPI